MMRAMALVLSLLATPALAVAEAPRADGGLPPVTAADRVLGRADAPVTIVEYGSFACSHCAHWHTDVLPQLKARFIDTGKVRLVFRDLLTDPVDLSATAAAIARCAAPTRYFDVADVLMRGQAPALDGGPAESAWYRQAMAAAGVDRAHMSACLSNPRTEAELRASIDGAEAAGVRGTPWFFVNGRPVTDHSLEGMVAAITPLLPAR